VVYVSGSTQKICQLTGEYDRERRQYTINRTGSKYHLKGTDLGASFQHKGRTWFLFGDSVPTDGNTSDRPISGDAIAYTDDKDPEACLSLQFIEASDGGYLSPKLYPFVPLGGFEVPTSGFSHEDTMYLFFTTNWDSAQKRMGRSVLAWSADDGRTTFHNMYDVSTDKYINISPVIVNNADVPGLPESSGQGLLMWCTGYYRKSDIYLSWVPMNGISQKEAWRYWGFDAVKQRVGWINSESNAVPLLSQGQHQIGELSVTWNPFLRKWLLLYSDDAPRGILFRTSDLPWGPWSPVGVLFDPWVDNGYCNFIHVSWDSSQTLGAFGKYCDNVHDDMFGQWREKEWGGEYGAYVISNYSTGDQTSTTIYYLMSTWKPYQAVLMKSTLQFGDVWVAGDFWVDFNYAGVTKNGTYDYPYSTLADGVSNIPAGRTLKIKTGSSKEAITITKKMRIDAFGGPATLGK